MAMNAAHQSETGWQVTVPATSANLGCAFDCGGLALELYLKAQFVPASAGGLSLEYNISHKERIPLDDTNLIVRSLNFAAAQLGAPAPQGRIRVESDLPVGVGLGSSAAAVIAGLLLGIKYSGKDPEDQQVLRWAEEIEGHIDNAAAAYHGGLVFALCNNTERIVTLRTAFPEDIRLVVVTPAVPVSTSKARKVLPHAYSRGDVVHTLQRTALLAASCFSGKFELFPELFNDRLHQPYRQVLVPGIAQCLKFQHKELLGLAISGSGSSVIAFTRKAEKEIAAALQKIFSTEKISSDVLFTSADNRGALVRPVSQAALQEIS